LFRAGDQTPVIPLLEVVGKGVSGVPKHTALTAGNIGSIVGFTVIVKVAGIKQKPLMASGVKV
jgi:hypothetical protein